MRRPLERLARLLANAPGEATVGELANKYGESTERIYDALDMLKLIRAIGALYEAPITYIPM
jgi:DNA-binding MurR/RpiR family transcriptional regulator